MRHIKPLFTRNITGCSAFRPYWILMDLVMFGLTPSLLVLLFINCLKHVWTISSNRKGEANYFPQVDLTHWNTSLKMIVKNHTNTKLQNCFINMPYQQNKCTCLPAVFQRTGVCFALCLKCPVWWTAQSFYWQNCFAFTVFPEFRWCSEAKIYCRPRLSARGHLPMLQVYSWNICFKRTSKHSK